MGIRFDGKVEPCVLSKEVMGDVNNNSLQEIWVSEEYLEIREKRFNKEFAECCENCDIYDQHMFHFTKEFYFQPLDLLDHICEESLL